MEPDAASGDGDEGRASAPGPASAFDDLATVCAAWLARVPRLAAGLFAVLAVAAAVAKVTGAEVLVVAAVAVLVTHAGLRDTRWTMSHAALGVLVALTVPAALGDEASQAFELSIRLGTVVAAGAATVAVVRRRVPVTPLVGVTAAVGCALVAALLPASAVRSALLAVVAVLVASLAVRGDVIASLVAAASGALAHALGLIVDRGGASVGGWLLGVVEWTASIWFALALVVRAASVGAPSAAATDQASARLVIRLRRRPWATALVGCVLGALFEPAYAVALSFATRERWMTALLVSKSTAIPFVALLAVSERGLWGIGRFVVATTLALAISVGASFLASGKTMFGSAPGGLIAAVAAGPWFYLAIAWFAGRRHSSGRSGPIAVAAACVATVAAAGAAWLFSQGDSLNLAATAWCVGAAYVLWLVLFHRLATCAETGRTMTILWITANACAPVATLALLATGRSPFGWYARTQEDAITAAAGVVCILGAAAMGTLHGAICVLAARRARSMSVVPDDHPLVADYGVDRRVFGVAK